MNAIPMPEDALYHKRYRAIVSDAPPNAGSICRTFFGCGVDELAADIIENRDGKYDDLFRIESICESA